jgi:hypothetical protein
MTKSAQITSRSWLVLDNFSSRSQIELIKELIGIYSEEGDVIFDPFIGNCETLFASNSTSRNGVSFSCDKDKVDAMALEIKSLESQLKLSAYGSAQLSKQLILNAGIENIDYMWQQYSLPNINLVISVLPHWSTFLRVASSFYPGHSVSPLAVLENILLALYSRITKGAYLILLVENEYLNGTYSTISWEIVDMLKKHFTFKYEKIVCVQKTTELPSIESEIAHKYLLVFRKK